VALEIIMTLGWVGNFWMFLALICLGRKWNIGWLFSIIGNLFWCLYAIQLQMSDMLVMDGACLAMAAYNWWLWSRKTK
jgi:hypothetical protein